MSPAMGFALLLGVAVLGAVVGAGACAALNLALNAAAAWLCLAGGALLAAGLGTLVLVGLFPQRTRKPAAGAEAFRRLRHDIRGALSPALLTADRLLTHADPAVQRNGDVIVRAVEKAVALLADPAPPPGVTHPDRP